jgi:tetratricopeptide (TPR) repeat protein
MQADSASSNPRPWLNWLIGLVVAAGAAAAIYLGISGRRVIDADLQGRRLALLPIAVPRDPGDDWMRWGLPALTTETLSLASGIGTVPTDALRRVLTLRGLDGAEGNARARARQMAAAMGGTALVEGTLRREGEQLVLDLQIFDGGDQKLTDTSLRADSPVAIAQALIDALTAAVTEGQKPIPLSTLFGHDPVLPRLYAEGLDLWQTPSATVGEKRATLALPYFEIILRNDPKQLRAKWRYLLAQRELGQWQRTEEIARELLEQSVLRGDSELNVQAFRILGLVEAVAGNEDAAAAQYDLAYKSAIGRRSANSQLEALNDRMRLELGRNPARAEELLVELVELQRGLGDKLGESESLLILGNLYLRQADLENAAKILGDAATLMQQSGDTWGFQRTAATLGEVAWRRGEHQRAADLWQQALEFHKAQNDPPRLLQVGSSLGEALLLLRSWAKAEDVFQDLRELAKAQKDLRIETEAAVALAWLQLRLGYHFQAREPFDFALAHDDQLKDRKRLQRVIAWMSYEEGHYDLAARSLASIRSQNPSAWSSEDEEFLHAFRTAAATGLRQTLPGETGSRPAS